MTREEYKKDLLRVFSVVSVLSKKENKEILRLRHRELQKDIVLRSYAYRVPAYAFLRGYAHENIPLVYDVFDADDGQAVLEEYVDGVTVDGILKTGKYKYRGAKTVVYQICSALAFLHDNGFVHRDIKPGNLIVTNSGVCKLIDFDVARTVDGNKTADTNALGTVGYAPPEQYGITQSDGRSDVYALGVLLNVMMTGCHPSERLAPGKAGRIVLKCTQIAPEKRFSGVSALQSAL